jgi:malate dehydrogenase
MTRDDLFNTNASIVRDLAKAISKNAPDAHILVISNPVNSTVPIVAKVLQQAGTFDPRKLFGVTTLDVVRASRFLSGIAGTDPKDTKVTVVGGHSGVTIVPLLSQTPVASAVKPGEQYDALVHRIQFGGDEVVKAKDGAGSATLSMAWAAAKFTHSLLRALNGEKGVIEPTFVKSPLFEKEGAEFFSSNVELGVSGVSLFQSSQTFRTNPRFSSLTVWRRFTRSVTSHPLSRSSSRLPSPNSRKISKKVSSLWRRAFGGWWTTN